MATRSNASSSSSWWNARHSDALGSLLSPAVSFTRLPSSSSTSKSICAARTLSCGKEFGGKGGGGGRGSGGRDPMPNEEDGHSASVQRLPPASDTGVQAPRNCVQKTKNTEKTVNFTRARSQRTARPAWPLRLRKHTGLAES
jgi:hypothetical protein